MPDTSIINFATAKAKINAGRWNEPLLDFMSGIIATRAPSTARYYRSRLDVFCTWASAEGITPQTLDVKHLRRYFSYRKELAVGPGTLRHDYIALRVFIRWLVAEGTLQHNPMSRIAAPRVVKPFVRAAGTQELISLLEAVRNRWDPRKNRQMKGQPLAFRRFISTRDYAYFGIMIEVGCRPSEACGLLLDDVNLETQQLAFRITKVREPRYVPITQDCVTIIQDWLNIRSQYRVTTPELFVTRFGDKCDPTSMAEQLESYCKYAGIPRLNHLNLRHRALTNMAEVSPMAAMAIAGHHNLKTTSLYLHQDPEKVRAALDVVRPLGSVQTAPVSNKKAGRKPMI